MTDKMIIAEGLQLTYPAPDGSRVGVGTEAGGLSFTVDKGEIFGVIGPDGAGKTTLFRLLASLLLPQAGHATVAGYDTRSDYKALRQVIGYMTGSFSLYRDLTVEENLHFFASLFGTTVEENYDLVKDIYSHIEPFKERKAKDLSGGMKQKLALSCALIHRPQVLFLDEPTTGVDPISRVDLWDMLLKLVQQGVTIVVSTPYMDEAAKCHRIAFMQKGQFVANGTPQALEQAFPYPLYRAVSANKAYFLGRLRQEPSVNSSFAFGSAFHFSMEEPRPAEDIQQALRTDPLLQDLIVERIAPTLEDTFLFLSQKEMQA